MARYRVKATAYIGDRIVEAGEEVDYDGLVSPGDEHLELIEGPSNAEIAARDKARTEKALRAEAAKLKLVADGGKPIEADAPIGVVTKALAAHKQSNAFA